VVTSQLERLISFWSFWIFNNRVILRKPRLLISNLRREREKMTKKLESTLTNSEVAAYCQTCFKPHSPSQTWTR
jgi:hypothetical protein